VAGRGNRRTTRSRRAVDGPFPGGWTTDAEHEEIRKVFRRVRLFIPLAGQEKWPTSARLTALVEDKVAAPIGPYAKRRRGGDCGTVRVDEVECPGELHRAVLTALSERFSELLSRGRLWSDGDSRDAPRRS
jgi:hypothetical protein